MSRGGVREKCFQKPLVVYGESGTDQIYLIQIVDVHNLMQKSKDAPRDNISFHDGS